MIILGFDPGYAIVGFGVVDKTNADIKVLDYGVITTPKTMAFAKRLEHIYNSVIELIDKYKPDYVCAEELFFNKNITTAIAVAQARGVILLASVQKCGELYEYTPLQIKQALTGQGRADKQQVQYMVKATLGLSSIPKPDDAADALAVAVCHAQTNQVLGNFKIEH